MVESQNVPPSQPEPDTESDNERPVPPGRPESGEPETLGEPDDGGQPVPPAQSDPDTDSDDGRPVPPAQPNEGETASAGDPNHGKWVPPAQPEPNKGSDHPKVPTQPSNNDTSTGTTAAKPAATVVVFVENRKDGPRPAKNVPLDGKTRRFADLWGKPIMGSHIGINGFIPSNAGVLISNGGAPSKLDNGGLPFVASSGKTIDLSGWTIKGEQR